MIDVARILDLIKDPDLKLKINDLYKENLQLKEENFNIKRKLGDLQKLEDIKRKIIHEDNHYFIEEKDNKDGPYCTKCLDADNKLIRLHKEDYDNGVQYFKCPNCNTNTSVGRYIQSNRNEENRLY